MQIKSFFRYNYVDLNVDEKNIIDICFESEKSLHIDNSKSLNLSQKAYNLSLEYNFILGMIFSSFNLAKINYYLGNYGKSKVFYNTAIKKNGILKSKTDFDIIALYETGALIYYSLDDNDMTLKIYNILVSIYKFKKMSTEEALTYKKIASIYFEENAIKKSLYNYKKALILAKIGSDFQSIFDTIVNILQILKSMKKYDAGIKYIRIGEDIQISATNSIEKVLFYIKSAEIYSKKDNSTDKAINSLKKALQLLDNNKDFGLHIKIYDFLSELHFEKNNLKEAFYYKNLYSILKEKDSKYEYSVYNLKDKTTAFDWSLVLHSYNIPHTLAFEDNKWEIKFKSKYHLKVEEKIAEYEDENKILQAKNVEIKAPLYEPPKFLFVVIIFAFVAFHIVVNLSNLDWINRGKVSSFAIFGGEWYRAITALTLHADFKHLGLNLLFGTLAAYGVCSFIGSGIGWFLILISGFYGNILNVIFRSTAHFSIGSSTSVFGALGILSGMQLNGKYKQKKIWVAPAGAIALFVLLGVGGDKTDIGAHFFGFIAGFLLGFGSATILTYFKSPGKKSQIIAGILTVILLLFSWVKVIG